MRRLTPAERPRDRLRRLRALRWPILETAGAAVVAWYLAKLLLGDDESAFAPIAAIICLGATIGQQRERALALTGGVVVGVLIADLLVLALGSGPPQVALMVVLAMSAAVLLGGAALLMVEAGVSAVIIGSSAPPADLILVRPTEALIGGGVAFAVHLLVFPPNPRLLVGRAANDVFSGLGGGLEQLSRALRTGERAHAEPALETMRSLDTSVRALGDALQLGRDTARSAPLRWADRGALERQDEISRHLDYAVRNARVLARDVVRHTRAGGPPAPELADAVAQLARGVWALAASFDEPDDGVEPRALALQAARRASEAMVGSDHLTLIEIGGQVRSTAVDLVRAAQAGAGDDPDDGEATEEMLAVPAPAGPRPARDEFRPPTGSEAT
jgi:uncharacterized membrane protein YgaE (UPF0421/DUF939 family)